MILYRWKFKLGECFRTTFNYINKYVAIFDWIVYPLNEIANKLCIESVSNRTLPQSNRIMFESNGRRDSDRDRIKSWFDFAHHWCSRCCYYITVGVERRRDTTCKYSSHRSSHSTLGIHRRSTEHKHVTLKHLNAYYQQCIQRLRG